MVVLMDGRANPAFLRRNHLLRFLEDWLARYPYYSELEILCVLCLLLTSEAAWAGGPLVTAHR
jgi:hypothetical protein